MDCKKAVDIKKRYHPQQVVQIIGFAGDLNIVERSLLTVKECYVQQKMSRKKLH